MTTQKDLLSAHPFDPCFLPEPQIVSVSRFHPKTARTADSGVEFNAFLARTMEGWIKPRLQRSFNLDACGSHFSFSGSSYRLRRCKQDLYLTSRSAINKTPFWRFSNPPCNGKHMGYKLWRKKTFLEARLFNCWKRFPIQEQGYLGLWAKKSTDKKRIQRNRDTLAISSLSRPCCSWALPPFLKEGKINN